MDTGIQWTNKSALNVGGPQDPILAIQRRAREIVLKAKETGWQGPPFNPITIAEMLGAKVVPNANISEARLTSTENGPLIEFNPRQSRERVRFSIAHEVAHLLFPDWHEMTRNRGSEEIDTDNWQLEMLCNIAASEFVLPIGSLPSTEEVPDIQALMVARRTYDVSYEAFLIRLAKTSISPMIVFFASPIELENGDRQYRIDYSISSPTAPNLHVQGKIIPASSAIRNCTAIGYTDVANEQWFADRETQIEYVGIPGYPGSPYPRVAGIVKFSSRQTDKTPIRYVHGNVLDPIGEGVKIICQIVNDKAIKWGGGVAKKFAHRFPEAENTFTETVMNISNSSRLGKAIFTEISDNSVIASIVAQEGFGPSLFPRLRYSALQQGLKKISEVAKSRNATIHMPRIGTGAAGGQWETIEELIEDEMVSCGLTVVIYDIPPKRKQFELF